MIVHRLGAGLSALIWLAACQAGPAPTAKPAGAPARAEAALLPPVAKTKPHDVLAPHGAVRSDPYFWLNERDNPEVLDYLKAENAYADAMMADQAELRAAIAKELADRLAVADERLPFVYRGWTYAVRFKQGADYQQIFRRKGDGPETMIMDVEADAAAAKAAGRKQYNLNSWAVSPDGVQLAYAVDFLGDRKHALFVKDLSTGAVRPLGVEGVTSDLVWALDNMTLFYVRRDPVSLREHQVWRHVLGSDPKTDALVFEEKDDTYGVDVHATIDDAYIIITSDHLQQNEQHVLDAREPAGALKVIAPREKGVRYYAHHANGRWAILTDRDAPDFRVMTVVAGDADMSAKAWRELIPERPGRFREDALALDRGIVVAEVGEAVSRVVVYGWDGELKSEIAVPEPISAADLGGEAVNVDPAAKAVRFGYSSPLTPPSVLEYGFETGELRELKRRKIGGGWTPEPYAVDRAWAEAKDGARIPITLIYRKDKPAGRAPTLVYGYGAYGLSMLPSFSSNIFSLCDRGVVYAIAHVRGGREMGDAWYQQGRMAAKMNTFTDFIAVAEALQAQGIADPKRTYAMGASAGGLLMGAVANLRPDLFDGVAARVPFVDALTTMLDASIPLTSFEWEEWGDPRQADQYAWMAAWSPYDNVEAKAYPALFVQAGLYDTQVAYFEPAKWVARLRATATGGGPILFRTKMDSGHSGSSGRLGRVEETSWGYAFIASRASR